MPDTAEESDIVLFELHAGPAPKAETSPREFGLDLLDGQGQVRGKTLDRYDEGLAVRFTRCEVPQHDGIVRQDLPATG